MRRALGALLVAAFLTVLPALAQAQAPSTQTAPAGQTAQPAQSQPLATQNSGQPPNAAASNPAPASGTSSPAAANAGAGYYWWWVAGLIAIVLIFWAGPRLIRAMRHPTPRPPR
jgi:hypothetical protein